MSIDLAAIAASFDLRAPTYGRSEWHRKSAERLVALCALRAGDRVLDAATGTGFAALPAAAIVGPDGRVLGIDISAGMLRQAEHAVAATGATNVELLRGDASSLPHLGAKTFDVVICATALLYMPLQQALREWHRLLAPGGRVAFSTMHAGSPAAARLFREQAARFGLALDDPCAPLGSVAASTRALDTAGFRVVEIITETIDFSPQDLMQAWEANVNSPGHADVKRLDDEKRNELRRQYLEALERQPEAALAPSTMLYAIGRRPGIS